MTDEGSGSVIRERYEILRQLGQGGFGRTLLAKDREFDREVAIKLLHPHRVDSWKSYELFEREAKVLHSLRHHGVPEVFEVFRAPWEGNEVGFLVMEYIEGVSIAALIEERRHLDPQDVTHIFQELLGILDYLHTRVPAILHRDIKPGNIIVRPNGFPTLVDFGAVRSVVTPSGESGSTIVGTYGYMPYEQHMGQASPSSDLYALAATFLHLLTGRTPPDFVNSEGRLEVPESLAGGTQLRLVLSRMLRPSPTERFQSAREVRQQLQHSGDASIPTKPKAQRAAQLNRGLISLPPVPRPISGETQKLFRQLTPGMREYITGGLRGNGIGVIGAVGLAVFGVLTIGVLPILLLAHTAERRARLRAYLTNGIPCFAEITAIQNETFLIKLRMTVVVYEFEVDGVLYRDSDKVYGAVTTKWRAGDRIEIVYLPNRNFDSVVISVV